ncbi:MAG: RiPP maturation radical SAM protein 1 [Chloroflexaceae bacterium]|nr:RiPP maturation radical SAM protein 1 [Chloroflexaceae bacterium]
MFDSPYEARRARQRYLTSSLLRDGEVLIIVPPFAKLNSPSLGAHLLQACAREAGFEVHLFYANLSLAATIGQQHYTAICNSSRQVLLGERFFAASAYELPPLGHAPERMVDPAAMLGAAPDDADPTMVRVLASINRSALHIRLSRLKQLETRAAPWADDVALAVKEHAHAFKVVGCTTTFEQTAASIALLKRVKRQCPQIITIIGGANCEGSMAEGVAALSPSIDYVFAGESEHAFGDFLRNLASEHRPTHRIIQGQPCMNLDTLPRPDFSEYFEQLEQYLPALAANKADLEIPYESSRGCWWGSKSQCTFCGLNGQGIMFREKTAEVVLNDLKHLVAESGVRRISMTDNIMPFSYFKTLVPHLAADLPGLHLFYEQKANLSLDKVLALKQAGMVIQPGIEALSTPLLKRMRKGVSAHQNIALLRYARSAGLSLAWNLLWGFPGDTLDDYTRTLRLLPLLRHLQPPAGIQHLGINRFSPYFDDPSTYGLRRLRPLGGYASILPEHVDPALVACYFVADYPCESHEHLAVIDQLRREIEAWQACWSDGRDGMDRQPPELTVTREADGTFALHDTRGLPNTPSHTVISQQQAVAALVGGTRGRAPANSPDIAWAVRWCVGAEVEARYVPLATATPELLQEFEKIYQISTIS